MSQWKSFNFFDLSPIKPAEESQSLFENNELTNICAGPENLFLGGSDGIVHILSPAFQALRSFKTGEQAPITHLKQIEDTSFLITISEAQLAITSSSTSEPVLQVWALDKAEKKTGAPKCLSRLLVQNGRKPFPVSSFVALQDLSQVAVGFANGAVTVIRGDLIHDRGTKQRTVFESEDPITALEVRQGVITTLYIATTSRILTFIISGRGQGQPAKTLDSSGCGVGCMTIDKSSGDLVVAREDAIYYYAPNGRGPCYAFDGPKKLVASHKDYLGVVLPPQVNGVSKSSAMRGFGRIGTDNLFTTSRFVLLDTDLKFMAHSDTLVSQVKALFELSEDLFLLTVDGKLFQYHEKPLDQKLDILYQRNLYVLAINLAQKAGIDALQQNVIYRKYGDYLYQKGDFDTAMQQYLRAIDNTEPSQVIRKYLDTQRMHNLIEYLEELHDHGKATPDHTTLLLNCYAKLKDVDKLESFIKTPGELKFDLDTAISMCRQGGYYEQAAYLATKHGEHSLVVDILIEDSKKYAEALAYIWRLNPELAYPNLMKYARVLLEHCQDDATQIFINYYTGKYRPKKDFVIPIAPAAQSGAMSAVQSLASFLPLPYMGTRSEPVSAPSTGVKPLDGSQSGVSDLPVEYDVPKPRTAFSSFVDHPYEFIRFLEACLEDDGLMEEDKVDLYTTLFEMYLEIANRKRSPEKDEWEAKAKKLINTKDIPIDASNVLLLSHLSNFQDGAILVRERQGLRLDIFRSYTSAKDTAGAIRALRKYGPEEPQLYPLALSYFTSSPKALEEAGDELEAVLKKIDQDGLMAPLQIIQALSHNAVVTMGMVKRYLGGTIERERKEISANRRLIETYRAETETKRKEIDEIGTKPVVFQARRCNACGGNLDLPIVHFLCKHSFHQRCLNSLDDNAECPQCAGQNATIRAIRKAQEESADRHDMFQEALHTSHDKFQTIGEFFGRGVMKAPSLE
ncbi:MAG: hypothetical protein M1834_004196 [Cirrosporium novae-zelandiae]|nr:MAG: hypothetical protein M1834_004196 [Cirrosporium novae-zelandiae]